VKYVAETGESLPIVDETGRELAWLIPATEPITGALLEELIARLPDEAAKVRFRAWTEGMVGSSDWVYHRPTRMFRSRP
jgi:hypothetical protein